MQTPIQIQMDGAYQMIRALAADYPIATRDGLSRRWLLELPVGALIVIAPLPSELTHHVKKFVPRGTTH